MQPADLNLDGIESAGIDLGKFCFAVLYGLGEGIAIGIGAHDTQQPIAHTGIHLDDQFAVLFLDGHTVHGLQVLAGVVHISPHAARQN